MFSSVILWQTTRIKMLLKMQEITLTQFLTTYGAANRYRFVSNEQWMNI